MVIGLCVFSWFPCAIGFLPYKRGNKFKLKPKYVLLYLE